MSRLQSVELVSLPLSSSYQLTQPSRSGRVLSTTLGTALCLVIFAGGHAEASAAPLVVFPFSNSADGNSGLNPSILDASALSGAIVTPGPGVGNFRVAVESWSGTTQLLQVYPSSNNCTTAASALSNNCYFNVALAPVSSIDLKSIEVDWSRGGSSGNRGWFLRSSIDNFASNLINVDTPNGTSPGAQPVKIDLIGFTGLSAPIDFRFYIYTPANNRSVDFQNLSFLPPSQVPGPLPLFGAAAAFTTSRRLRSRLRATANATRDLSAHD